MLIVFWLVVFVVSLALLVKGADWLLESAEKIGLSLGLSPFIVGVTIVGVGTSFPELISSIAAVFEGVTEIVPANAIGSNIANILLIIGISAIIGKRLMVNKSLIDLDLPLLAVSTVLLLGVAWDGQINIFESLILLFAYITYLLYTVLHKEDDDGNLISEIDLDIMPSRADRRKHLAKPKKRAKQPSRLKITYKEFVWLAVGIVGLVVGAKYLIDSVIQLSTILNIGTGVIAITAVAFGTSLPELLVSAKAAMSHRSELAIGNIFGSNIFNSLVVIGLPGLITTLNLDRPTLAIGVPTMALATLLFVISGISRRIYIWEGVLYILVYLLFVAKLFDLF